MIERASRPGPPAEVVERCRRIPTSTWSDALDRLGIEGVIPEVPLRAGRLPMAGPAATILEEIGPLGSAPVERFGIDIVLEAARPGDVVVIAQRGEGMASAIGGLAALSARNHGVAGIVVDGAVRDLDELVEVGLAILSRRLTPASGRGRAAIVATNVPVAIGAVDIHPGDVVVADATGVVVLPIDRLDDLLPLAEERARSDEEQAAQLRSRVAGHDRRAASEANPEDQAEDDNDERRHAGRERE